MVENHVGLGVISSLRDPGPVSSAGYVEKTEGLQDFGESILYGFFVVLPICVEESGVVRVQDVVVCPDQSPHVVSIATLLQERRPGFRQRSVRVLMVVHGLQCRSHELDVSDAVESGWNGDSHIAWPDGAVPLGSVDDRDRPVRE